MYVRHNFLFAIRLSPHTGMASAVEAMPVAMILKIIAMFCMLICGVVCEIVS